VLDGLEGCWGWGLALEFWLVVWVLEEVVGVVFYNDNVWRGVSLVRRFSRSIVLLFSGLGGVVTEFLADFVDFFAALQGDRDSGWV
jgi:hypothetical protein